MTIPFARLLFTLLIACFCSTGCQAMMYGTAEDFNKLQLDMSRQDVITQLGQPMTIGADATGEERLIYKRMAYRLGWSPTLYDAVLKDEKVVRYGVQP